MKLSRRAQEIPASVTLGLDARCAELKAAGKDVISLGAGQPDFPGPPEAIEAARAFLDGCDGRVRYTPSSGIPELRAAAAAQVESVTGVHYEPSQVVVTCGAKEAIALSIFALTGAGDEILVPTPAWLSYEPMAMLADVKTRFLRTEAADGFKLRPEALRAAITPETRVLVLNTPGNPSGVVYSRDELTALAAVLDGTDVAVISDEIYWPFVYEGEFCSPAGVPGMAERCAVVNGVSKTYSMTGWRVGYVAAPAALARCIASVKSHTTSNASATAQHAALGALRAGDACTRAMVAAFARRRTMALDLLGAMPDVEVAPPGGAFYLFPRVDAHYSAASGITDSVSFCEALLDETSVACVPGAAFQEDRCIRLSYAIEDDRLREALDRIAGFLQGLRSGAREATAG